MPRPQKFRIDDKVKISPYLDWGQEWDGVDLRVIGAFADPGSIAGIVYTVCDDTGQVWDGFEETWLKVVV
jgi:hypothetical protein